MATLERMALRQTLSILKMIKTDLELLEQNRNDAQSMVLALQAQINLTNIKIIGIGDNEDRAKRENMQKALEKELEGHKKMVREFDSMIKLERENQDGTIRVSNKENVRPK